MLELKRAYNEKRRSDEKGTVSVIGRNIDDLQLDALLTHDKYGPRPCIATNSASVNRKRRRIQ